MKVILPKKFTVLIHYALCIMHYALVVGVVLVYFSENE